MRTVRVFVTGASGMIGSELVDRLRRLGLSVVALAHTRSELKLSDGSLIPLTSDFAKAPIAGEVVLLRGDVRHPRLGLDDATYQRIVDTVDLIIHCAAITDFRLPPSVYPPVNTDGTAHAVALAWAGGTPKPMIYVSTAYVCGWRQGRVSEDDLDGSYGFINAYEESKYKAELLVRASGARGMPFVIARPSILVGASRTGRIREFHNIYVILKLVTEGCVRVLPGSYDATLDLVPIDYVVTSLVQLATNFDQLVGRCFHLTNGRPITFRDMSEVLTEYPTMLIPRIVPPQSFDLDARPPIERRLYLRGVKAYDGYFRNRVEFVNDSMLELLAGLLPRPVHGKQQLRQLIDYCEKVGFLGNGGSMSQASPGRGLRADLRPPRERRRAQINEGNRSGEL